MSMSAMDGVGVGRLTVLEQKKFNERLTQLLSDDEILSGLLETVITEAVLDTDLEDASDTELSEAQMDRWLALVASIQNKALLAFVMENC